eukprot:Sro564_g167280.1 n/a (585) ;mRNA; r:10052-11806
MTADGTFKSVSFDFRGEVLRAVVEFVLTDTAKILDIRSIRADKRRRSSVKSIHSAPPTSLTSTQSTSSTSSSNTTNRISMFDWMKKQPLNHSSNASAASSSHNSHKHKTSKSVSSRRSGGSRSQPIYSRAQIQTLVSLTRAAQYFQLPNLGSQALDTIAHYLERSPPSVFSVLESCRQEEPHGKVPKELQGIAQVSLRNFVGPIEPDTVEFLTPPVLEEILQTPKLRMDEYQLFKILKRWASSPAELVPTQPQASADSVASNDAVMDSSEGDAQTVKSGNQQKHKDDKKEQRKEKEKEKQQHNNNKDDQSSTTDTSRTASVTTELSDDNNNHHHHQDNNSSSAPLLSTSVRRKMVTAHFLQFVRLECIDPPILATSVASSGLVTEQQLLRAFQRQAMASHKYHGIAFQRPRFTGASWKKSLSEVFTSRHSDELKEDVLQYPPIQSGIHRWTVIIEESGDSTWLGLTMSNLCETFTDQDAMQDRNWVYGCDGGCFFGGRPVEQPSPQQEIPGYGTGSQVTLTLNLKSRDKGNGTLYVGEQSHALIPLFTNLRHHLNDHEGEGFLPSVSMHTPGRVRLVDIRHLHS